MLIICGYLWTAPASPQSLVDKFPSHSQHNNIIIGTKPQNVDNVDKTISYKQKKSMYNKSKV